jgi:hypothetical protein
MRLGRRSLPVMIAGSAMLCIVAILAFGPAAYAQGPGSKKAGDNPGADAGGVEWKPDAKLDWSKFTGGMPGKDENGKDLDAETYAFIQREYSCKNGEYSLDVHAEFVPKFSKTNPKKQSAALLAHEQIHFDIWQKYAAEFKKKLADILKEKCKCKMSAADEKALREAVSAAYSDATRVARAKNKEYDDETDHGTKETEQQQWAKKIAGDLGQPAPTPPPAPKADGDDGSGGTPKAEKPANCKDCEAAEAERKKKLADLKTQINALNTEHSTLFKQVEAIQRDIDAANAEKGKAKTDAARKAADGKIRAAEGKQAPIKTKMEEVDKKRSELEQQAIPLEQPTHCPKCPASAGDSSFEPPPGDEFAGGSVKGHGDFCSPPQETYIPGTPGGFSEQYASEIPGNETPGEFVSYSVPFASDSTAYCTFGEGTSVPGYSVSTGDDGSSAPPSSDGGTDQAGTPAGPGTKIATGNPKTPLDDPPAKTPKPEETPTPANPTPTPTETPKRAETPTPTPTPTETPKTPDQPPPTKTTDNPPPDIPTTTDTPPVTIFIKASETVLEGSETGEPIQGQIIKLVMKEKPALPTTTENRTAMDKGFDKPAPQCTTAGDGQCRVDIPAEDRSLYALKDPPRTGGKPLNNYRLAINVMNHTGGVAETTGKQVPAVNETTSKGDVTAELFRIGNRTFVRLGFNTPSGVTNNFVEKYSGLLGVPIEVDICLIKEPGPPLGSEPVSYGAINQELPASVIRLRPASARVSKR